MGTDAFFAAHGLSIDLHDTQNQPGALGGKEPCLVGGLPVGPHEVQRLPKPLLVGVAVNPEYFGHHPPHQIEFTQVDV